MAKTEKTLKTKRNPKQKKNNNNNKTAAVMEVRTDWINTEYHTHAHTKHR